MAAAALGSPPPATASIYPQTNQPDIVVWPTNAPQLDPSVVINVTSPDTILIGGRAVHAQYDPNFSPYHSTMYWSTDGGASWAGYDVIPYGDSRAASPAIAPSGEFLVTRNFRTKEIGNFFDLQSTLFTSNLGGYWSLDYLSPFKWALDDESRLAIDNTPGSPYSNNDYIVFPDYGTHIQLWRRPNGGGWSFPDQDVSSGTAGGVRYHGPKVVTGPNGEVYVCWSIYDSWPADEAAIGFNKSTDGGVTWQGGARKIANIRGHRVTGLPNVVLPCQSFPTMAVDVSNGPYRGTIYVAWTNVGVPGVNTGTDTDIWLARSTDEGATFSTPIRVNDDDSGRSQWLPTIACDPVTGSVAVSFYDRREDPGNTLARTCMAISGDGGSTWSNFLVSDVPYLPSNSNSQRIGLALNSNRAFVAWTDPRTGVHQLYAATYQLDQPPGPSIPEPPAAATGSRTDSTAILSWTNPTRRFDGSPLGSFAGLRVYRDSALVAEVARTAADTGSVDGYVDHPPLEANHTYWVSAIDSNDPPTESLKVKIGRWYIGHIPRIVVWEPPGLVGSDAILAAIQSLGLPVARVTDLFTYSPDITVHEILFALMGTGSSTHVISSTEGAALNLFVQAGRGIYLEGGDCFEYDILNKGGYSGIPAMFGLNPYAGDRSLVNETIGGNALSGFRFYHSETATPVDLLIPSASMEVMHFGSQAVTVYNSAGGRRAIGTAVKFGRLIELAGETFYTRQRLMWEYLNFLSINPVGVGDPLPPRALSLSTGFPNPFRAHAEIQYELPATGLARVEIFDIAGRRIRALVDGVQTAGRHSTRWDGLAPSGRRASPGLYFVTITAGGEQRRARIVMLAP